MPEPNPHPGFVTTPPQSSVPMPSGIPSPQMFSQPGGAPFPPAFGAPPPPTGQPIPGVAAPNFPTPPPPVTMHQGNEYKPEDFETGNNQPKDGLFDDVDEVLMDNEKSKSPFSMKMMLIIGGVVAVLAIVVLVIAMVINGQKESDPLLDDTEITAEDPDLGTEEDLYAINPVEYVDPDYQSPVLETAIPEPEPEPEPEPDVPSFVYPDEQRLILASYGYNNAQIEALEAEERPFEEVEAEAKKAIQDKLTEQYNFLLEQAYSLEDEEVSEIISNSWYGLPPVVLENFEPTEEEPVPSFSSTLMRENVNYEKVPLLGKQTFLKLTLNDDSIVFFPVSPQRYVELEKDSGNLVIKYDLITGLGASFVLNIQEIKIQ